MANFFDDNDDLKFYVDKLIDWRTIYENVEFENAKDKPYKDAEEAKETWRAILDLIGDFSANEVAPRSAAIDSKGVQFIDGEIEMCPEFDEIFTKIKQLDLHGLCIPRDFGGMNCPFLLYLMQGELLARGDVTVMTHHGFHGGMAMVMLMYSALEGSSEVDFAQGKLLSTRFSEQISTILKGEAWGAMDITEPDAGSDMGALRSTAELDDDKGWLVTGQKIFVTAGHARYHFVVAKTEEVPADDPKGGLDALSLFLVETYTPKKGGGRVRHATIERAEHKLGHHGSATVTINFDETPGLLVGERGDGFRQMLTIMNNARISVGFESLGLMEAAYRAALDYARGRPSMGKTIDRHEMIADYLDEMETDILGIRALAMKAAFNEELSQRKQLWNHYQFDKDSPEGKEAKAEADALKWKSRLVTPLIKFIAAEKAVEVAQRAIQIHGGHGYMKEYPVEKLLRDALVLPIYEGTSQIQALMAMKDNLLWVTKNPAKFARRLGNSHWEARFSKDPLTKRVAAVQLRSLKAQRYLMTRIVGDKLQGSPTEWAGKLQHLDAKRDFGPALLHAEKLTWLLADAAICRELLAQTRRFPERESILLRYLERAEPRGRDMLHRIQHTGERILQQTKSEGDEAAA